MRTFELLNPRSMFAASRDKGGVHWSVNWSVHCLSREGVELDDEWYKGDVGTVVWRSCHCKLWNRDPAAFKSEVWCCTFTSFTRNCSTETQKLSSLKGESRYNVLAFDSQKEEFWSPCGIAFLRWALRHLPPICPLHCRIMRVRCSVSYQQKVLIIYEYVKFLHGLYNRFAKRVEPHCFQYRSLGYLIFR